MTNQTDNQVKPEVRTKHLLPLQSLKTDDSARREPKVRWSALVSWLKDILEIGWTEPDTQIVLDNPCPRCNAIWPICKQRNWKDGRVKRKCKSCGFNWHEPANVRMSDGQK